VNDALEQWPGVVPIIYQDLFERYGYVSEASCTRCRVRYDLFSEYLFLTTYSWTIVKGFLDINRLGTGPGACYPREDNLELESEWKIRDRSSVAFLKREHSLVSYSSLHRNPYEAYWLAEDIPGIITAIMNNGADIAIVSQNMSKAL